MDLMNYFKGEWRFKRSIQGTANKKPMAHAVGTAVFMQQGSDLFYREDGRITYADTGHSNDAYRAYRYDIKTDSVSVYHASGEDTGKHYQDYAFETPKRLVATEDHQCRDDCYNAVYDLLDENSYSLTTIVKGPKKDYTMQTVYTRVAC